MKRFAVSLLIGLFSLCLVVESAEGHGDIAQKYGPKERLISEVFYGCSPGSSTTILRQEWEADYVSPSGSLHAHTWSETVYVGYGGSGYDPRCNTYTEYCTTYRWPKLLSSCLAGDDICHAIGETLADYKLCSFDPLTEEPSGHCNYYINVEEERCREVLVR